MLTILINGWIGRHKMAFANSDWDAAIDASNGRVNGLGPRAQRGRSMAENMDSSPQDDLNNAHLQAIYNLHGLQGVRDYISSGTATDPAANPSLRRSMRLGMSPSEGNGSRNGNGSSRPAPNQDPGGPLGMGRSAEDDYYGRNLARGVAGAYDASTGVSPTGATPTPPKPLYSEVAPERQKIDIKFAPGFAQPEGVAEAFSGTGQYQGQPATRFPDDIHEDQPGTISNARQQFEQDIAHLHSQRPDPNDAGASRDWEDTNAGVISRMDQHAAEARRIGNESLAKSFEAIAAGSSPHEAVAAAFGGGPGAYQMQNAQTARDAETRKNQEFAYRQQKDKTGMAHQDYQKAYIEYQKQRALSPDGLATIAAARDARAKQAAWLATQKEDQGGMPTADTDAGGGGESWRNYVQ